jgi:cytochrome c biogenesis protein CcmG/thiol:disulfide interchange protein DsbE
MSRLPFMASAAALVALAALFFRGLPPPPENVASSIIGTPAPDFALPALDAAAEGFTSADLRAGHVSVVNVWASWCVPCRAETPALAAISRARHVVLYGIVYEDRPAAARKFLAQTGNPFARLDLDADGRAGRAWRIGGVPETFIVDRRGVVRLRFAGPIAPGSLADVILPAIARVSREG